MPASGPSAMTAARSTAAASMAVSLGPLRGAPTAFRRSAVRPFREAQFAGLVKFCYLLSEQSFSYNGDCDGGPVFAGIDHPPVAGIGGRSKASIGDRGSQATSSHPARGHPSASQLAGVGGTSADPAYQ